MRQVVDEDFLSMDSDTLENFGSKLNEMSQNLSLTSETPPTRVSLLNGSLTKIEANMSTIADQLMRLSGAVYKCSDSLFGNESNLAMQAEQIQIPFGFEISDVREVATSYDISNVDTDMKNENISKSASEPEIKLATFDDLFNVHNFENVSTDGVIDDNSNYQDISLKDNYDVEKIKNFENIQGDSSTDEKLKENYKEQLVENFESINKENTHKEEFVESYNEEINEIKDISGTEAILENSNNQYNENLNENFENISNSFTNGGMSIGNSKIELQNKEVDVTDINISDNVLNGVNDFIKSSNNDLNFIESDDEA